jgi:hypothetical protein
MTVKMTVFEYTHENKRRRSLSILEALNYRKPNYRIPMEELKAGHLVKLAGGKEQRRKCDKSVYLVLFTALFATAPQLSHFYCEELYQLEGLEKNTRVSSRERCFGTLEVIFFWFRKVFSRLRVPDATICRLKPSP